MSLKNVSTDVLLTPIKVVIESISDPNVTAGNQDGFTLEGKPYFVYTTPSGQVLSNSTVAAKKWVFSNPKATRFTYTCSVWAAIPDAAGTIGPAGGNLQVTDLNSNLLGVKIDVPPGALTENKLLLIREVTSPPPLPDEISPAGPAIDLSPTGTVFQSNIRVTVPYNDANNDGVVDYTGVLPNDIRLNVYDDTLKEWHELAVIGLDTINHTVTFETNHFSTYRPTVSARSSGKNVFIFTIPGLDICRTLLDFFQRYVGIDLCSSSERSDYLRDGILQIKELGLNYPDVYPFSWSGSAYDTPELMDKLNQAIENQYEKNKGKKFVVVTHSWGTVLGILALQYNTHIKPDLFISLSSPLGSDNITKYNNDIWWNLPGPFDIKVGFAQEVIYDDFTLKRIDETHSRLPSYEGIDYVKWINYWDDGDIISGPLTPNYRFYSDSSAPPVEDRKANLFGSRDIGTTWVTHAVTSLDENTWKDNYVSTAVGKAFRDRVRRDIESAIGSRAYNFISFDYPDGSNTHANGINNSGQIVGDYSDSSGNRHGFLKDGVNYSSFDYPELNPTTYANGINDSGQIVGGRYSAGFLKDGLNYSPIHYPGSFGDFPLDINNNGQIVGFSLFGFSMGNGFFKDGVNYSNITYPGTPGIGGTHANGINDSGQIVGTYYEGTPTPAHGFLKDGLNYSSFDYPGSTATYANSINDSGQIVGFYSDSSGKVHGFLATPE